MKINVVNSNMHFNAQFKTKEILSFITQYPLEKGFYGKEEDALIEFMTGLNLQNKDYFKKVYQNPNYDTNISKLALESVCIEEMVKQNPVLKDANETCDAVFAKIKKDKSEIGDWLNLQIKKIGKTVNIEPFKCNRQKLAQNYKELEKIFSLFPF